MTAERTKVRNELFDKTEAALQGLVAREFLTNFYFDGKTFIAVKRNVECEKTDAFQISIVANSKRNFFTVYPEFNLKTTNIVVEKKTLNQGLFTELALLKNFDMQLANFSDYSFVLRDSEKNEYTFKVSQSK